MKTFNKTLIAATTIATLGLAAAPTALSLEGSAGISTSYLWRGEELGSGGSPAFWGDISDSTGGLSYGLWVTSGDSQTEFDTYVDYSGEISGIGYSIGYIDYNYADRSDGFEETYVGLSYGPLSVTMYNDTGSDSEYTAISYSTGAFTFTYGDASVEQDAVAAVAGSDATVTAVTDETTGAITGYTFTPAVEAVDEVLAGTMADSSHFDVSYAVNDSLSFTLSKPDEGSAIVVASYSMPF